MKVLIHVDEEAKWPMALGNAANLLAECARRHTPCALELVANGGAVGALAQGSPHAEALAALLAEGAVAAACANALRGSGLTPEQLLPGVTAVPAGVYELAEKQAQGYAYLKP